MSVPDKSPDLSLLLARSIVKVKERKREARIWTEDELASVNFQIEEELWRIVFKAIE